MTRSLVYLALAAPLLLPACNGDRGGTLETEGGSATDTTSTGTETGSSTATTETTSATTTATGTTTDPTATTTATTTTTGGGTVDCEGKTYQCGNGIDDDMDGKIDAADPECTGPCDDDESSFQTGIPGDNVDCKQDCFFDGNSGQGDDGCNWDLKCDPANPGADIGCEYTGGPQCMQQQTQTEECIEFCSGLTPNGCDCFGCCTVEGPDGPIHIFLNSGGDCSLDNLDACQECTPSEDCSNDCTPENCELCFGEDELPEGCDEPTCPEGDVPCGTDSECPDGLYCVTGCCIEYTPPP